MRNEDSEKHNSRRGYLRLPDVLTLYPVSKSTWWAGIRDGRYPAPVKLSERVSAWRAEDINELIERTAKEGQR